jgi:hypothetical protein
MREVAITVVLALVAAVVATGLESPHQSSAADAGSPDCVKVRPEVHYGALGYDHIVHLRNVCDQTYQCTVKTDVNPKPIDVAVPARFEVQVVTFRGSPARVFVAYVDCHPQ